MARKFSHEDIEKIKNDLQRTCEESWRTRGYKQTSIPFLTKSVGISAGAFYLMYERKEDLFLAVLENVQKKLLTTWSRFINEDTHKIEGFKKGLQWLYEEYQTYPNLYDINSAEYDLFLAKLPNEEVKKLQKKSIEMFEQVIEQSKLKMLRPENEVIHIIHSILFLSLIDRETLKGTQTTFNFLLETTLYNLFEEENENVN